MIINISIDKLYTIDKIKRLLNAKILCVSGNVIWCDGFYIKLINGLLEINVYSSELTEKNILYDIIKPVLNEKERTFIRIQKGRMVSQFVFNKNEKIDCVLI